MRLTSCDLHIKYQARCPGCRKRQRWYHHHRRTKVQAGTWRPGSYLIGTGVLRKHVLRLTASGMTYDDIARHTRLIDREGRGVSSETIGRVVNRPRRVHLRTAALLIRVKPDPRPRLVPGCGARRRVEALMWNGWTRRQIFREALGWMDGTPHDFGEHVLLRTHEEIVKYYEQRWHIPGPSKRTRTIARRAGYAPPGAWDDETIDDPKARPKGVSRRKVA